MIEPSKKPLKRHISLRLLDESLRRLEELGQAERPPLSLTYMIERAILDYLDGRKAGKSGEKA